MIKIPMIDSEARLAAAVELYELGRLSSGAAATLAGIPRTVFLAKLGDFGVDTFNLSRAELERDCERAGGHLQKTLRMSVES